MESVAELKGRLLKRAAGVNRGLNCREEEQKEFVDIIERLEVGRLGGVRMGCDRAGVVQYLITLYGVLLLSAARC